MNSGGSGTGGAEGDRSIDQWMRDLQKQITSVRGELPKLQANIVGTLAVFVALFTFVSVQFSLFQSDLIGRWSLIGLTLMLLGALTIFVLLLQLFILQMDNPSSERESNLKKLLWGAVTLLTVGVLIAVQPLPLGKIFGTVQYLVLIVSSLKFLKGW